MATLLSRRKAITLPFDVQERYRLKPDVPVRIIETRSGILLVPLTEDPMTENLAQELRRWQALGQEVSP